MGLKDELQNYNVNTGVESGWGVWSVALGGLAVALAVALDADPVVVGSLGVFVTATARGVGIVLGKLWGALSRKLDESSPPPKE